MSQPYIVIKQSLEPSSFGGEMVRINLRGVKDRKYYVTYIVPGFKNHTQWTHIIINPESGFVLNNLTVKTKKGVVQTNKEGDPIIDADSNPVIEAQLPDYDTAMQIIQEYWNRIDNATTFLEIIKK
jgi:hypothetical protein